MIPSSALMAGGYWALWVMGLAGQADWVPGRGVCVCHAQEVVLGKGGHTQPGGGGADMQNVYGGWGYAF